MDAWANIRLKARACHADALATSGGDRHARALVAAAVKDNGLEVEDFGPEAGFGNNVLGFVERASQLVNVARGQAPEQEAVVIAHEIGHFLLHTDPSHEVTMVSPPTLGGDPIESGAAKVQGYSSRERKEVQADVFAGEFLCPSDWLRVEMVENGRKTTDIASELGLPSKLVLHQAIRALLLPPLQESEPEEIVASHGLDESQAIAATWAMGPLMVDAGPGTGKTRTLIHRVGHILDQQVSPASILALTFSNKAAEEMRIRLSATHPDAAIEMWVGTFHAFGMELIAKWADRVGRTDTFQTFDEAGSLELLERNLARLPLKHFQNLYDPAFELIHVLRAISRCKDELIDPDQYLVEAERALALAPDDESVQRAVEVGRIYKIYEEALLAENAVDFGDLVRLPVKLLQDHPDIRQHCHQKYAHILVDEYQDVNLASARLLRLLVNEQRNVWVVADQRQSIYRFRGAKPANVAQFAVDFSGARHSLTTNYRSGTAVVRAFGLFSHHMSSDPAAGSSWDAHRGELGGVSLTVCPTVASEAAAIRDQIEALKAEGVAYRDQVILARTHLTLSRITEVLEQLNVPMLYLGDLFERSEIRDLLSLIAIDAEHGNVGLARVVQLPEYNASKVGAGGVIGFANDQGISVFEALRRLDEIEGIPADDYPGLSLLGKQLAGMNEHTSPWTLVTTWLFERSGYLKPLLNSGDALAQQRRIAIYQFLKVCGDALDTKNPSRRAFLERVRRVESLRQDHAFRAVSSEASDFDAVRVMTLHGSKGLEFRAVHLPGIATRYMPMSRQWNRCPPPTGLAHLAMGGDDHEAEEECLFFVGMSRARDFLCLSRAEKYTTQNASPSKFIEKIQTAVQAKRGPAYAITVTPAPDQPSAPREVYEERELDLYLRCPARYRYERIDRLLGGSDASAYLRFHRCVQRTLKWVALEAQAGKTTLVASALNYLGKEWEAGGPRGHGFEAYYRSTAETMVTGGARLAERETGAYDHDDWLVDLGGKGVMLKPDRVAMRPSGVCIQLMKTGRQSKSEPENRIYTLMRRGAAARYAGSQVTVETYYPALDQAVATSSARDAKNLDEYSDAIAGIEQGQFAKRVNEYCPSCPCYFICGA